MPGGRWRVAMVRDDTGERHVAVGTYLEVEPPRWLKYTHAWQAEGETYDDTAERATIVTVELFDEGDGTRMVFTQTGFESVASRNGHHDGWSSCFDRLSDLVEGRPVR